MVSGVAVAESGVRDRVERGVRKHIFRLVEGCCDMAARYAREIDDKSKEFIQAVQYYGGEASTTEIRKRTGLNHNEVSYRFEKLSEMELIEISYADAGQGSPNPPKLAHLSGEGRKRIEQGLFVEDEGADESEPVVSSNELVEFESEIRETVERLETRLDVVTQSPSEQGDGVTVDEEAELRERLEAVSSRVESVESRVGAETGGEVDVGAAPAVQGLDKRVAAVEADVAELEEYVDGWTEFAETYFLAIREVLESELGVEMDSYLAMVEDGPAGGAEQESE